MSQGASLSLSPAAEKIKQALGTGRYRALLYLLVVLLVVWLALAPLFPGKVVSADAPAEAFSAERALAHLPVIAGEAHPSGSPAQARVRDYLIQQLTGLGLTVVVQQAPGADNVLARLAGAGSSGAILLQAHYDSYRGPGAADNGAGVAALLEVMRALAAGPAPRSDILALFDDSEEMPDPFTGTKAFIRSHPWMADVRVAIGMDTAARGFICTDDTGPDNGWMVDVLAHAYTGGAWTSLCGGGNYDTQPFRQKGIRVLELEDNYPFHEQHTPNDVPAIVSPGSLQQLGEQALAVAREAGSRSLENTSGEQQTYMYVLSLGLLHYPEAWALPLAILAGVLLVAAFGLSAWQKWLTWRSFGVAFVTSVGMAGLAVFGASRLWKAAPGLLGWETQRWSEWPEVIPPGGWTVLIVSNLVILVLMGVVYGLARRWSTRASFSLFSLSVFLLLAVAVALSDRRGAILATWPVLIGAAGWVLAAALNRRGVKWAVDAGALLAAIPAILFILPLIPGVFMGDGTKSAAITSGAWVIVLAVILPAVDGLYNRREARAESVKEVLSTA